MLRFSTWTAVVLTGAFGTMIWGLQSIEQAQDTPQPPSAERVRELLATYGCFKHTLTVTLCSLENGELPLEEARVRIHDAALRYFPEYLEHIKESERETNEMDRIARNLIGHLRHDEASITLQLRVLALEVEYAEIQRRASARTAPLF
jgi:hypothetical protein